MTGTGYLSRSGAAAAGASRESGWSDRRFNEAVPLSPYANPYSTHLRAMSSAEMESSRSICGLRPAALDSQACASILSGLGRPRVQLAAMRAKQTSRESSEDIRIGRKRGRAGDAGPIASDASNQQRDHDDEAGWREVRRLFAGIRTLVGASSPGSKSADESSKPVVIEVSKVRLLLATQARAIAGRQIVGITTGSEASTADLVEVWVPLGRHGESALASMHELDLLGAELASKARTLASRAVLYRLGRLYRQVRSRPGGAASVRDIEQSVCIPSESKDLKGPLPQGSGEAGVIPSASARLISKALASPPAPPSLRVPLRVAVDILRQAGVLIPRDHVRGSLHVDAPGNPAKGWSEDDVARFHVSVPGCSVLCSMIAKGRAELATALRRSKDGRVTRAVLEAREMKQSPLETSMHVLDAIGAGLLQCRRAVDGTEHVVLAGHAVKGSGAGSGRTGAAGRASGRGRGRAGNAGRVRVRLR